MPPKSPLQLEGLRLEQLAVHGDQSGFNLMLTLEETDTGLQGWWEYNAAIFEDALMVDMLDHFQVLLRDLIAEPDRRLSDWPCWWEEVKVAPAPVTEMEQASSLVLTMLESLAEGMAEEDAALSARQCALITLAVALTLEDSAGVAEAVAQARQLGMSEDEIEQVKTLVILQRARRVARLG